MDWNDETNARLRQFWDDGLSTAEIGRRLSVSKNAVVGKAHRMMLQARPSPIRRDAAAPPRPAGPKRITGPTLPPLSDEGVASLPLDIVPVVEVPVAMASVAEPVVTFIPSLAPPDAVSPDVVTPEPERPKAAEPVAPIRAVPTFSGRHTACCWPLGDPGTKSFRFCDGLSLPGKPYCAAHAQLAYVKVRDRREEAA